DLEAVGADGDPAERDEGEVTAGQTFLDGAEHRLVCFDVDVDVLKLADLLPVAVDQIFAVPLADVLVIGHSVAFSRRVATGELSSVRPLRMAGGRPRPKPRLDGACPSALERGSRCLPSRLGGALRSCRVG